MFNLQKISKRIFYSLKVSIVFTIFLILCLSNTNSAHAQNFNLQALSNNAGLKVNVGVKVDSLMRIGDNHNIRIYNYIVNESSSSPEQIKLLNKGLKQLKNNEFKNSIR